MHRRLLATYTNNARPRLSSRLAGKFGLKVHVQMGQAVLHETLYTTILLVPIAFLSCRSEGCYFFLMYRRFLSNQIKR
jgi:hypothetical protein